MDRILLFALMTLAGDSLYADRYVVSQKNKTFLVEGEPVDRLRVTLGDSVDFRNDDPFFHNVFSLSGPARFDLGIFPKGESRTVTFDKVGEVEIECSIHPYMHLKIEVVEHE